MRIDVQNLRNTVSELRRIVEIQMNEIKELKKAAGLPEPVFYPEDADSTSNTTSRNARNEPEQGNTSSGSGRLRPGRPQ
jgi:hypothetical protein